jgi:lysophospholipid acyltransferase (LPLAT)-like uncharacterized protein
MLRAFFKSLFVRRLLGRTLAGYLRFVKRTNRVALIPANAYDRFDADLPVIITMWHGQHFMQTFFRKDWHIGHVMISRHGDGEINAIAAESLGMRVVRGSGAQRADQVRKRGGIQALRQLIAILESGESVSMTADVPKISRVASEGTILIAQRTGRPIYPVGVVCSFRKDFKSWDRASLGLPFGRTAMIRGEPIWVERDASPAMIEAYRQKLETELDRIYALGYASFGQKDPGADRPEVAEARAAKHAEFLARSQGSPA